MFTLLLLLKDLLCCSKFERTFEAIRKNDKDYKETLRKYSFRKPRREVGISE